jgi:TonB family protein
MAPRAIAVLAGAFVAAVAGNAHAQYDQRPQAPPPPPAAAPKLTKPPALLKTVEPVYPSEAVDAQLSADVTLVVDIDATGHVTKADVPRPAGHGFDEAARTAVLQYLFSPAEIDNKPAAIRIEYTLHFVPKMLPPEAPEADAGAPPDAAPPPPPPPPPPPEEVVAKGRLREKGTRNPLKDAEISVIERPVGEPEKPAVLVANTDMDGRFEIRGKPGVALRVIVADAGHDPCIRDLTAAVVNPTAPAEIDCVVARRLGTMYETTVRAPPPKEAVTRYTLAKTELTTVPGTFGDPLRVVQNLPGVARTPFGLGLLVIRGASHVDSGIYVEGHTVPILYHFLGGPSVLSPRLINNIAFYPGNFGVPYGRATAGIIDFTLNADPTPRLHGEADINFLHSAAYVEGPLAKGWSGSVSARRSYIDLLLPLVLPSNTTTASPVYWDYQVGVHRELPVGRIALFGLGSNDTLKVVSTDPSQGNLTLGTETGFHKFIAVWSAATHGWVNRLSPAYGYQNLNFGLGQVGINQAQHSLSLRDQLTHEFSKQVTWRLGFDGVMTFDNLFVNLPLVQETRLYGPSQIEIQPEPTKFPLDTLATALYTDATLEPIPGLTITPGLRGDYFRYVGQNRFTFDPRIVFRWQTSKRQAFKAGVGRYHRMQEPQLLNATYGTPTLDPIAATQYSVGYVRYFTDKLSLDSTLYYIDRRNEAVPAVGGFTDDGRSRAYGLELILKHEFTERFFGWIAYTLSRAEQTAYTVNGASTSGGGFGTLQDPNVLKNTWYPTDFDQTHNLIFVGSYTWRAWRFGSRFRYVSGSPDTKLFEGVYDADAGVYACRQGPTNASRKPSFNQLDVRVERTWTFTSWQFSTYLDIQNVYNAENPEFIIYDYRCRGAQPVRGVPFLPILGLKGMF